MLDYQEEMLKFLDGTPAETDKNYPSVEWIGFMKVPGRRHGRLLMRLYLIFVDGQIFGWSFFNTDFCIKNSHFIQGEYDKETGKVSMLGIDARSMPLLFEGYNEGKNLYGRWVLFTSCREISGGFIFWTYGSADPTRKKIV